MNINEAMMLAFLFGEYLNDRDEYFASKTLEEMDEGFEPYMSFAEWSLADRDYLARVQERVNAL